MNIPSSFLVHWKYCGGPAPKPTLIHIESSELTVRFRSSQHISGRGFLLSYSIDNHKGNFILKPCVIFRPTQSCQTSLRPDSLFAVTCVHMMFKISFFS